ncbi:MAG TPA: hypothetical protein VK966_08240 [Longimicrobiales bacterium]|nr:hypothetical protein [Longimicrobiales bacterium]
MKQWEASAGHLSCPVCRDPLETEARSLRCAARHSYDVTREGYVDLLPTGHGRSKRTGDAMEMVRARERFLYRGHFRPLADGLVRAARAHQPRRRRTDSGTVVLEAGCGPGYYLGQVARRMDGFAGGRGRGSGGIALGTDVSPDALRVAARAHPAIAFFRNDIHHRLCVADACVDLLLNVFAPRSPPEFARVTRPGGTLLAVVTTPGHLHELRDSLTLLGIRPEKRRVVENQLAGSGYFVLDGVERLERRLDLEGEDVLDLLKMTPNYWRTEDEARQEAAAAGARPVTLAVEVLRFTRTGMAIAGGH